MKGAIFTTDKTKGMQMLQKIVNDCAAIWDTQIIDERSTRESHQYRLDNGDSWSLIVSKYGARGRRLNIAYIDRSLGVDFIREYILPCLICLPFTATHYFGEPRPGEEKFFTLL